MHVLLIYELAPSYLKERVSYRAEHLRLAWEAADRGELLAGGVLDNPATEAMLLFQGESEAAAQAAAQAFAQADPYIKAGLVTRWSVRAWNTVVGKLASSPLRGA